MQVYTSIHYVMIHIPGDSKWPFHPPVGGDLTILKRGHVFTISPKKHTQSQFLRGFPPSPWNVSQHTNAPPPTPKKKNKPPFWPSSSKLSLERCLSLPDNPLILCGVCCGVCPRDAWRCEAWLALGRWVWVEGWAWKHGGWVAFAGWIILQHHWVLGKKTTNGILWCE